MPESGRNFGTFDFFNPFMSAVIVHPEYGRLPIWLNEGGRVGTGSVAAMLDATSYSPEIDTLTSIPYLAELTIENQLGNIPIITATLTPPYREGLMILDSKGIEWGLSQLECQLGYVGGSGPGSISPVYRGVMLKPEIEIGAETRITFNGQGVGGYISSKNVSDTPKTQSRKAHMDELAKASWAGEPTFKFEVVADPADVPPGSNAAKLLAEEKNFSAKGWNRWEALQKLAGESACYLVHDTTDDGKNLVRLIARSKTFGKNVKPVATLTAFDYDGSYGPDRAVFPILSATSPTSAVYLNAGVAGLRTKGVSSNKEILTQDSTAETSEIEASTGPKGDVKHRTQKGQEQSGDRLSHYNRVENDAGASERQTRADGYRGHIGIRLEIETLGIPTIFPGDLVRVRGLGKRLCADGGANYTVLKVVHTYSAGGYTTSLDLVSTSSDLGSAAEGAPVATSETETDEEANTRNNRSSTSGE